MGSSAYPGVSRRDALKYAAGAVLAGVTATPGVAHASAPRPRTSPGERPNILVVFADDQRYDTIRFMPALQRLQARGTSFEQARQSSPLCTPARATLLRGQMAVGPHGHGVEGNVDRLSPEQVDESLAPWLATAGYHCGMAGKYFTSADAGATPPGWSWWRGIVRSPSSTAPAGVLDADDYGIFDGSSTVYPQQHQMNYLTGEVERFVRTAPEPWFLWDCPTSPHWLFQPTPRRAATVADARWPVVGADTSGKPSWMRELPAPTNAQIASDRQQINEMLLEVLDLDDHLAAVLRALRDADIAERTTIIYTSDNGDALLDYRIPAFSKNLPYDVSSQVPLVCAGPRFPADRTVRTPVSAGIDVTATCLDLAHARATVPQDGVSLIRTAARPRARARRVVAGSCAELPSARLDIPENRWIVVDQGDGLRKLIRYVGQSGDDEFEAYDLDDDPDELHNWANEPRRRSERRRLEAALERAFAEEGSSRPR